MISPPPLVEQVLVALRVPVELGFDHPAEVMIDAMIADHPTREMAGADLVRLLSSSVLPGFLRALARCRPGPLTIARSVLHGLAAPDAESRSNAIDAAEEAGGRWMAGSVRSHAAREPLVYLADHARRVADLLEGVRSEAP